MVLMNSYDALRSQRNLFSTRNIARYVKGRANTYSVLHELRDFDSKIEFLRRFCTKDNNLSGVKTQRAGFCVSLHNKSQEPPHTKHANHGA